MSKWWMVRAGDNNELIPAWITKEVASIGWSDLGNPLSYSTREKLIEKAHVVYPKERPGTRINWGSQVWKFSREISVDDNIITYSKETREYLVGKVHQPYSYNPKIVSDYYPNVIGVKWESKRIPRDDLSKGAKNSLGGIATVFRVDSWGNEIEGLLQGNQPIVAVSTTTPDASDTVIIDNSDYIQQAMSLLEDAIDQLDAWKMQDLIGGLLEAMGYQVRVSPKGPDGGVDIIAHRDAFGFENPIIKVQVKHRKVAAGGPEIQQLLGANPIGASSLFVSTGGFTSQAKSVAQQHGVKLIDLTELVELVTEWYERMTAEKQSLLPLKKVYVPNE
ncbi:restriction endonuclease [Brevibacillus brevis]|uniref:restriction endonuclease n=1 Tax=Brevibacillus brevis TaxID=1393 RepID=UPI0025A51E9D|nr:restriction endonuclease [Brevibacillus brevis]WJQ79817.1 restriction endonuclease [Brevibacillus brevis]